MQYLYASLFLLKSSEPHEINTNINNYDELIWEFINLLKIDYKFIEIWFKGSKLEEIKNDNIKEFIALHFFDRKYADVEKNYTVVKMINESINEIELVINHKFEEGYNNKINFWQTPFSYKLPLLKPFILKIIVELLNFVFLKSLKNAEFLIINKFEYIKLKSTIEGEPSNPMKPIIFFHGIGIGLVQYMETINQLQYSGRDIYIIQLNWATIRLFNRKIPPIHQFLDNFDKFMIRHQLFDLEPVFLAHSYGSHVISWLIKKYNYDSTKNVYKNKSFQPYYESKSKNSIKNIVLVEATAYTLHSSSVIKNIAFLHQISDWSILLIRMVLVRDYRLMELFFRKLKWYENIITFDMMPEGTQVYLSGDDDIIDIDTAIKYNRYWQSLRPNRNVILDVKPGLGHGDRICNGQEFQYILEKIKNYD